MEFHTKARRRKESQPSLRAFVPLRETNFLSDFRLFLVGVRNAKTRDHLAKLLPRRDMADPDLAELFDNRYLPSLTLDVINITKSKQRAYFQYPGAAFTYYEPGRMVMVGLRGSF